jgi:hypothetical protein
MWLLSMSKEAISMFRESNEPHKWIQQAKGRDV